MRNAKTKNYTDERGNFTFDKNKFNELIQSKRNEANTISSIVAALAEYLVVSVDTVKNWRNDKNAPCDINTINKIATYFQIDSEILKKRKIEGNTDMKSYNKAQIEALKKIYDACIDYLNDFLDTDGFCENLWLKYLEEDIPREQIKYKVIEYADNCLSKVHRTIKKEYFYLNNLEIYEELLTYCFTTLVDIYDGKTAQHYRYDSIQNECASTFEDYDYALTELNGILERYGLIKGDFNDV